MNVRQVRKKIRSVTNVKKITKAIELVSAVKVKKTQQMFFDSRSYNDILERLLYKVIRKVDPKKSPLLKRKNEGKKLIVLITSDKGLCGGFNSGLFRYILKNVDVNNADFITIGKKGAFFTAKLGRQTIADFSTDPLTKVSAVFQLSLKLFLDGSYSHVLLVYNKFISTLRQVPIHENILPITLDAFREKMKTIIEVAEEYVFEPSLEDVLESLLKNYIEEKMRFSLLSNEAGEHSARMIAMKNATDSATDLILELTLQANKLRQTKITNELVDMTTAKESAEGEKF